MNTPSTPSQPPANRCEHCQKPVSICVCDSLVSIACPLHVLILQHPQEPDEILGSARIAHLCLPNSTLKVGLSWPNLKRACGIENADPKKWGVLYLGSQKLSSRFETDERTLVPVSKNGEPILPPDEELRSLEGLVVIDGTWAQAKAIWWRNAWLSRLKRFIVHAKAPSHYRELRREPRRESISTLEAIGYALEQLTGSSDIRPQIEKPFIALLDRIRKHPSLLKRSSSPKSRFRRPRRR